MSVLSIQVDERIGGCPRHYFGDEGRLMIVPDEIRKCVGFVGYNGEKGFHLGGTVFFVGMKITGTPLFSTYAITAKHVIDGIQKNSIDGKIILRVNLKNGGATLAEAASIHWVFHPGDSSVDVAICPATLGPLLDHLWFPAESFATTQVISKEQIGVGDEVFLTGLFRSHTGTEKNIPIVRVGNIAAMPEERVSTRGVFGNIEAFLVEARSIGGLSGSPVFVKLGLERRGGNMIVGGQNRLWLLGLMHGHFDVPESAQDLVVNNLDDTGMVNVGIAIVVPAGQILEVLNSPIFVAQREQNAEKWRADHAATPDTST